MDLELDHSKIDEDCILFLTDLYKHCHWAIAPKKVTREYAYLESRGVSEANLPPETLFFGLQYILKRYLCGTAITEEQKQLAAQIIKQSLGHDYFNYKTFDDIINKYNGRYPVRIKAVKEGTLVPAGNVLMTIENTDPSYPQASTVTFIEDLLQQVWYPTTVCTESFRTKRNIIKWAKITGGSLDVSFHLNDFMVRGVSSMETARIGGMANMVNFKGTDNLPGIIGAMKYYNAPVSGYSVFATEHSETIIHGEENEDKAYDSFLDECPEGIISIVTDSYNHENAVDNILGKKLRTKILSRNGKVVIRPDSGYPPEVMLWTLISLEKNFGSTRNSKGYKVLNPKVGVLYGDFIDYEMIDQICQTVSAPGAEFSTDCFVFGRGGTLGQKGIYRDKHKFALKTSAAEEDGIWRGFSKHPKGDASKKSKEGRLMLILESGKFVTKPYDPCLDGVDQLVTVYENGKLLVDYSFDEIRQRAESYI